jgi:serine/threonine protein kinase
VEPWTTWYPNHPHALTSFDPEPDLPSSLSQAPEVLVCPDKRKPEENKDKAILAYGPAVDSWAVGVLTYELLCGYPPFEQDSRALTYEYIMYKPVEYPPIISDTAKSFIAAALCKVTAPSCFD